MAHNLLHVTHKLMMYTKFGPIHVLMNYILLLLIPSSTASATNANYTVCSSLFSYGNVHIGYPFYGYDRPAFCGLHEFRLSCRDGSVYYNLASNNESYITLLHVLGVNDSSHSMMVSLDKFFELYFNWNVQVPLQWNTSSPFKLSDSVTLISLFRDCKNLESRRFETFNWSLDGSISSAYYFTDASDISGAHCSANISIPVSMKDLFEMNSKGGSLLSVVKKGFEINYSYDFTTCLACENSGGRCGSTDGPPSLFVCHCPHGPQSLLCPKSEHKKRWPLILGLSIAGGLTLLVLLAAIWCRNKLNFGSTKFVSRRIFLGHTSSDAEKGSIYFGVPLFSYRELDEATNSFHESRELGDGGFGTVYYGKLKDGREVAVKRLFEKNYKRVEQFMNEVQILTRLRHQNLVTLYGCTSSQSRELLLVYEYVPNGTVADHLYGDKSKPGSFQWPVRLRIAIETASALAYLHASDIIHRDIKTNNILLDSSFSVKVADFGLSRLFPTHVTHVSTAPQGTPGYLDPEYHQCYQLTDKSDVYSFGVVLIELISSLTAVDMERHRQEINLSNYAMNRIQRCAFDELVDPNIGYGSDFKVTRMTTSVAELAFQCLQHDKEFRPSMDEVLESLKRIEDADYEALKAEEEKRNHGKMSGNKPPPSPSENDDVKLLVHHRQTHPESPDSVMGKWGSRSTTPSTSKGNELTDC